METRPTVIGKWMKIHYVCAAVVLFLCMFFFALGFPPLKNSGWDEFLSALLVMALPLLALVALGLLVASFATLFKNESGLERYIGLSGLAVMVVTFLVAYFKIKSDIWIELVALLYVLLVLSHWFVLRMK